MLRAKRSIAVKNIFKTPWFSLESVKQTGQSELYYRLSSPDSVAVLAVTPDNKIVLVRQFRPAINQHSLEFPAGHMNKNESPQNCAHREFLEETGYACDSFVRLGTFRIANSRLNQKVHMFFGSGARPSEKQSPESGVERVLVSEHRFHQLIKQGKFTAIASIGLFYLAKLRKLI